MGGLPTTFGKRMFLCAFWMIGFQWILKGALFSLSAMPTRAISMDGLILVLFSVEAAVTAPGRWMQSLVPGEQAIGAARWLFFALNALVWGIAAAASRVWLGRFRSRASFSR